MFELKKLVDLTVSKILSDDRDVYEALKESQFVPFFQPLVTLRTGQLAGYEMLARWQHPVVGLISPDEFVLLAEQGGWIDALTRQLLEKAFVAASDLTPDLTLAINISPLQLRDPDLPGEIRSIAAHTNFDLSRLVIEITESALIDNLPLASTIVGTLRKMGCKLALDDFGTGYSSLHHLHSLPFDELKVDRSFVSSMTEKRESRKNVSAVVGLGHSLGLVTIAEGIETQEQAEMLLWLGCEVGQGYFFGRPIPAEELAASVSMPRARLENRALGTWKRISASELDSSPSQRLAQLQAVYDGAPVGLAFVDQNLRYLSLNKRLADMNGASVEDHRGSLLSDMIPDFFPSVEPYVRRALQGEVIADIEVEIPRIGATRLCSYQPARDEFGEIVGVSIAIADITERKRLGDAMETKEGYEQSQGKQRILAWKHPEHRLNQPNPPGYSGPTS